MSDYRNRFEEKTGYKERNLNPPADRQQYDFDFALFLLKELKVVDNALELACNEIWRGSGGLKMPSYYYEKYMKESLSESL